MNRILFVDDDAMVLQGLQRMLRSMRGEWEMVFAEGGAQALELMARTPFDAVVSDMRMPGMTGAQLLNEVKRLYPRTLRFILSGQADKELVLLCASSMHQFLAKPCPPETLKKTLRQAFAASGMMPDNPLRQLVSRLERLPSLPAVYNRITHALHDPDVTTRDLAGLITGDLAMSAQVLRLVNSAFFGLARPVSNLEEAVEYIGLETLRGLVLTAHIFSEFQSVQQHGFNLDALWDHSRRTAAAARIVALCEGVPERQQDDALAAGLLHDLGKLVLAANLPADYTPVHAAHPQGGVPLCTVERRVFGATHADVGGLLLGLWGLTPAVSEAVRLHHEPLGGPDRGFSTLTAIHVANALVHAPAEAAASNLDLDYLHAAGLDDRLPVWRQAIHARILL